MAKKQFIRHLEFYGFPDQNKYSSDVNGVDLSDIIAKNKEQDEEIKELTDEKASKKDFVELSGTVESVITAQSAVNEEFFNAIAKTREDIIELREIDNEFGRQISAVTSSITDIYDEIETINENVNSLSGNVGALTSDVSGLAESFDEFIVEVSETYAKKDEIYTKEEVDDIIARECSGYATTEWVEEKGYISEESADAKYATIESFDTITNTINEVSGTVNTQQDEINIINSRINVINGNVEYISGIVSSNVEAIEDIYAVKADKEDIQILSGVVDFISGEINSISGIVGSVTDDINFISGSIDSVSADVLSKVDKVSFESLSGFVYTLSGELNAEIERSISADTSFCEKIDEINDTINSAITKIETHDELLSDIEEELQQEIENRIQADLALIGSSGDDRTEDTIWAAKNFSKEMKRQAIVSAKTYTDEKYTNITVEILNLSAATDLKLSSYVKKDYVDARDNEISIALRSEISNAVSIESDERIAGDIEINNRISDLATALWKEIIIINNNTTRINALTEWDGEGEYSDEGNGVVDVLHREFHDSIERISGAVDTLDEKLDSEIFRAKNSERDLQHAIDNEIQRATTEENNINYRIDNLVIDCGIY